MELWSAPKSWPRLTRHADLDSPGSANAPPFSKFMANSLSLPLCDERGNQLRDERGPISYSESEARTLIARGMATIRRGRGKDAPRYLVHRNNGVTPKCFRSNSMQSGAPYVVREQVGQHHVYKHVAHRCSAAAVKPQHIESPINKHCM